MPAFKPLGACDDFNPGFSGVGWSEAALLQAPTDIDPLRNIVDNLHQLRLQQTIPELSKSSTIEEIISQTTGPELARTITHAFQQLLPSSHSQITAFQASEVYTFSDDDQAWQLLEWHAGDMEGMAIFQVDDVDNPESYNCLVHCGVGKSTLFKGRGWGYSSLAWNVTDMWILNTLFQVARHIVGILHMSAKDVSYLYCLDDHGDCSTEEYRSLNAWM
jgi:hypothetical protein